jgi:hypothetical protein
MVLLERDSNTLLMLPFYPRSPFGLRTSDSVPWRCENPFRSRRLGVRLDSHVRANNVNIQTWGRQTVRILMSHYTSLKGAVSVRNRVVLDISSSGHMKPNEIMKRVMPVSQSTFGHQIH